VAHAGEQLEHFHAYLPRRGGAGGGAAVGLHTDGGLFIAMVPAMYARAAPAEGAFEPIPNPQPATSGFLVQRADGTVAGVPAELEDSSVVIALGDGWRDWLNPSLRTSLRSAPHSMVIPPSHAGARLWYGRMFLPPRDALLPPHGVMFADHRAAEARAVGVRGEEEGREKEVERALSLLPSGCASGKRFVRNLNSCGANQILCWHQCMDTGSLPCNEAATCRRPTGEAWLPEAEDHVCPSCLPTCDPASPPLAPPLHHHANHSLLPPPPPHHHANHSDHSDPLPPHHAPIALPPPPPFCTGPGSTMHMFGFSWMHDDCTVFLFGGWSLNTAGAFAGGVIGTFLLGVLFEWLKNYRFFLSRLKKTHLYHPCVHSRFVTACTFMGQATVGYFLMLLVMTYQTELFLAAIFGLGVGHMAWNSGLPLGEQADPCCIVDQALPAEKPHHSRVEIRPRGFTSTFARSISHTIKLGGMTNDSTSIVQQALLELPGVSKADVTEQEATVLTSKSVTTESLIEAIQQTGKQAFVVC